MNLHEFRVLTFDVVGTLIDFERGILDCVRSLPGGDRHEGGVVLEAFGRSEGVQQGETPHLPFTQMLEPIYRRMAGELGLPESDGAAAVLRESIPRWPAFGDAPGALAELGRRYRLVALTNADSWAVAAMSATLGEPFDDAVCVEDVGVNKPDPQMWAYCLGRQSVHGYTRGDVLHVAQSQYHDIAAAQRLGYRTCWVERRQGEDGYGATPVPRRTAVPDLHVASLAELAEAVRTHA